MFRRFWEDAKRASRERRKVSDPFQSEAICSPGVDNTPRSNERWDSPFQSETVASSGVDNTPRSHERWDSPFQSETVASPGVDNTPRSNERRDSPLQSETICLSGADVLPRWSQDDKSKTPSRERGRVLRRGQNNEEERWIFSVGGVELRFNWIPAGKFSMGFSLYEQNRYCEQYENYEDDEAGYAQNPRFCSRKEKPAYCYNVPDREAEKRRVAISRDFWLMDTPVTVAAFDAFLKETGRLAPVGAFGYDAKTDEIKWGNAYHFANPGFPDFDASKSKSCYPATCVSWKDAVDFCDWLTDELEWLGNDARTLLKFRLPTEAEWERACRAETTSAYFFGSESARLPAFGNYDGNDGFPYVSPVKSFASNDFGLFDMHGDVWEWCADWYAPYPATWFSVRDPDGPSSGSLKTARGGAWNCGPDTCRSATRGAAEPWVRAVNLGFRVAMDVYED